MESTAILKYEGTTLKHTFPKLGMHPGAEPSLQLPPTTPAQAQPVKTGSAKPMQDLQS